MTSHDVVARLRRITGESMIGHLGTLDPMATGVLPVLLGKYTRLAQFFGPLTKSYTGAIRFGFATDTYDADGAPLSPAKAEARWPTNNEVQAAAAQFQGRDRADAAALLRQKDRWQACVQGSAPGGDGGVEARVPGGRGVCGRRGRRRLRGVHDPHLVRAVMCARSRTTWGRHWAAARIWRGYAGLRRDRLR